MSRSLLITAIVVGLLTACGLAYVGFAQPGGILHSEKCALANPLLVQYGGAGSQRDLCLENCQEDYGGWFGFSENYAYDECVQECEDTFWNQFDRSMRNLEREGKFVK